MFQRAVNEVLRNRLLEPRRFVQFLQGPRQVGKTTSVKQVLTSLPIESHYANADAPENQTRGWVREQWQIARSAHARSNRPVVLVMDEVQKVDRWSDIVKQLWDEDTWHEREIRVALLGSSPWLMDRGMGDSMAGRFETIRTAHWTWPECRDAFGISLEEFAFYGGYPGALPLISDPGRWRSYVEDAAIESTVVRDVLHMSRVDKPALLRQALYLSCEYSGRELSLQKMRGQLEDIGSLSTVAHYLGLLDGAGLIAPLQKYAGQAARRRASVPKLQVRNNALLSAVCKWEFNQSVRDYERWGRLVESCVGAYLAEQARVRGDNLTYWRDGTSEVDFVYCSGTRVVGIEVKTALRKRRWAGLAAFADAFGGSVETLVVGEGGMALNDFLCGEAGI